MTDGYCTFCDCLSDCRSNWALELGATLTFCFSLQGYKGLLWGRSLSLMFYPTAFSCFYLFICKHRIINGAAQTCIFPCFLTEQFIDGSIAVQTACRKKGGLWQFTNKKDKISAWVAWIFRFHRAYNQFTGKKNPILSLKSKAKKPKYQRGGGCRKVCGSWWISLWGTPWNSSVLLN